MISQFSNPNFQIYLATSSILIASTNFLVLIIKLAPVHSTFISSPKNIVQILIFFRVRFSH